MGLLETLDGVDKQLLLYLNSLNSDFGDVFMWILSEKVTWLPLILVLLYIIIKNKGREAIFIILGLVIAVTLADQISSSFFKPFVERLRPSRNPEIMNEIHIVNGYRGGKFGFVSSHAANVFAVAIFTAKMFRSKFYSVIIFLWAAAVAYSRVYLGVHYPFDIICGGTVGILSGCFAYWIYQKALVFLPAFRQIVSDKPGTLYTMSGYLQKEVNGLSGLFIFFFISVLICSKIMLDFVS